MPSRPHLVIASGKTPSNTRLTIGNFIADILIDSSQPATVYHWIVQRLGSAQILSWGQEQSFEAAEKAARGCLADLNSREHKGHTDRSISPSSY